MRNKYLLSPQVFGSKTKESDSFTSGGTRIIIALSCNSCLSQRWVEHSSCDKGKISEGSNIAWVVVLIMHKYQKMFCPYKKNVYQQFFSKSM